MFPRYFASSLGSPLHRLAAAVAATLPPPFPRIVLLKLSLLSTFTAGVNGRTTAYPEAESTDPMSYFLLNECGLCQSELSTVLKFRPAVGRTRSAHTARQAVQFLRDSGMTEDQVKKMITSSPVILALNADRQLKPKLQLMKTLGFTLNAIPSRLLASSIEKTLYPNIHYLQKLLGSEAKVSKAVKQAPQILSNLNGHEYMEKKLKHLASFGLSEDEVKEAVRKRPGILIISMDKVQKYMDFFVHTAGFPAKILLTKPVLLTFSLECRIKPRYRVLKSISAMQPLNHFPSLSAALCLTERKFLEKYVKSSPDATKLLEI